MMIPWTHWIEIFHKSTTSIEKNEKNQSSMIMLFLLSFESRILQILLIVIALFRIIILNLTMVLQSGKPSGFVVGLHLNINGGLWMLWSWLLRLCQAKLFQRQMFDQPIVQPEKIRGIRSMHIHTIDGEEHFRC